MSTAAITPKALRMTEGVYRRRADALIKKLLDAKNEAASLELWRTFHSIDEATTAVGWELADKLLISRRDKP